MKFNIFKHLTIFFIIILVTLTINYLWYLNIKKEYILKEISVNINFNNIKSKTGEITKLKNDLENFFKNYSNSYIKDELNKNLSLINFPITLFTFVFSAFLLITGYISFNEINNSKKLLNEIQNAPEKVLDVYYSRMLPKIMLDIFNDNSVIKSDAIKNLTFNPCINKQHYSILKKLLLTELSNPENAFSYGNIVNLIEALLKIDYDETKNNLFYYFEKCIGKSYSFSILNYAISLETPDQRSTVKKYLTELDDALQLSVILQLIQTSKIDADYINFIIKNCSDTAIINLITQLIHHGKMSDEYIRLIIKNCACSDTLMRILINQLANNNKMEDEFIRLIINNCSAGVINSLIYELTNQDRMTDEYIRLIINNFTDKDDVMNTIVNHLVNQDKISNEYTEIIIVNCSETVVITLIGLLKSKKNIVPVYQFLIKRDKYEFKLINYLINLDYEGIEIVNKYDLFIHIYHNFTNIDIKEKEELLKRLFLKSSTDDIVNFFYDKVKTKPDLLAFIRDSALKNRAIVNRHKDFFNKINI